MTTLPFKDRAVLVELGGAEVEDVDPIACSIWPATSSGNGPAGRHHTHTGEAALKDVDELRVPNRALRLDGRTYRIQAATPMDIVPHVVLELVETSGRS